MKRISKLLIILVFLTDCNVKVRVDTTSSNQFFKNIKIDDILLQDCYI
jgi:hypothetical protein